MPTGVAGTGYSLSFWIIVNDYKNYRYGQNKYILEEVLLKVMLIRSIFTSL